jgi:outer membrane protease
MLTLGVFLLLTTGAWLGIASRDSAAEDVDWTARAIEAWSGTCQKCHSVPDAAFETDRAFLGQIRETS